MTKIMNLDYLRVEWEICPKCGVKTFYTYYKPTGVQGELGDRIPAGKKCRTCGHRELTKEG